ncbi:hypothetical protein HUJ05_008792 [Dendroctonus ponderosae]|nr:hypothetical protein HUJ05_008792 [Dendroctonus ponderosae]
MADKVKNVVEQALQFIIAVSYLVANFIMMIWAIVYVGWKTLILMTWANLVWLLPFRKQVILVTSPVVVAWVWFLLITSYLYSMDLTEKELPTRYSIFNLKSGVDRHSDIKWFHLLAKSLFGVIIFVTMRQFFQARALKKQREQLAAAVGEAEKSLDDSLTKSPVLEQIQAVCVRFFAVWWIWLVIISMIWMDFWSTSNLFRIAFVCLAFLCILTFQIAVVIQQNYLQQDFDRITSPTTQEELEKEREKFAQRGPKWAKVTNFLTDTKNVLFQILEVHLQKITLLVGWCMCVFDMCALYVPIVILFTASCMFGHSFNTVVIYLNSCWVQLLIILRLLYMNQYHGHDQWNYVGYYVSSELTFMQSGFVKLLVFQTRNGHPFNKTLNTADWLGFHQSKHGLDYADFSQVLLCFLYLGMATLTRVVAIWMKNFRISRNIPLNQTRVLFPDITYLNCHDNTGNMLKFFANYGFYRFGCEIPSQDIGARPTFS